jgi:DNA polymerase I
VPTLALLDGHSIAYRAFFALPEDLATTSGQVTNSVYGFTRMLIKLLGDHHPDAVAVAWDVGRQTFRTEQYPEYKAQRATAPDNFKSQLPLIREVLEALDISQIQLEGYEADDVIASLSERAVAEGWDVMVVTGDRDAFQLVDPHRRVLYTRRGITDTVIADAGYIEERYGIRPDQYVEYAALRGDNSDNLPGVVGVGEKTAARLISGYGSLEGIYDHLPEQTPKLRENLVAGRDQVFLNRDLMRLVRDLDLDMSLEVIARRVWDQAKLRQLFVSLEFHSLWEDLLEVLPEGERPAQGVIDASGHLADSTVVLTAAARGPLVTDLLEVGDFVGIAVLEGEDSVAIVPLDRLDDRAREALADPLVTKHTHDAKRIIRRLGELGIGLRGVVFDTALAAYVLDPSSRAYDLATVVDRWLGAELDSADHQAAAGGGQGAFDFSDGPDLDAAARRVVAIHRLVVALEDMLGQRDELGLYRDFEIPLIEVLAKMEVRGIAIDRPYLEAMGDDLRTQLSALEAEIHALAGEPFNVNSTDQLATILYTKLSLPVLKKTGTGKPSTDASVLEKLDHPLVERLLRYRELEKLRSTYVDGYLPLIAPDGRIHTRFNQMAASTGRLSSEEPNLQNIPVRSDLGRTVRRAFIPEPDWKFVVADYSQIELRVLAHMSGEPALIEAFRAGADIHTATAARVFGVPDDLVSSEMRRLAKMINFGLLYGMEAFGLADRLGISRDEARTHIDAYFSQFRGVKDYLDGIVVQARRDGYTSTLFGRRRYLPELKSDNFRVRQMGERMALNAPIQGTAADVIKKAMVDLDAALAGRRSRLLLQIHDELVLEAPIDEMEEVSRITVEVMASVADLAVPLVADVTSCDNLAEAK